MKVQGLIAAAVHFDFVKAMSLALAFALQIAAAVHFDFVKMNLLIESVFCYGVVGHILDCC